METCGIKLLQSFQHRETLAPAMAKKINKAGTTGFRPTPQDTKLIKALREKTGLANSSLMRLALRRLAEAEGIAA